jgi:multimeric flavodoxin WrbA
MIKILGIAGSPRQGGNTTLLLQEALRGAAEAGAVTEKVMLCKRIIHFCTGCLNCSKTGRCVIEDGMEPLYKKALTAHGVIISAPIYFNSLNAQTKVFVDRFQCIWERKYRLQEEITDPSLRAARRGLFLSVAGLDDPRAFDGAVKIIDMFFRVIDIPYHERLSFFRMYAKGAVNDHPTALSSAHQAGKKMAEEIARHLQEEQAGG